MFYQVYTKCIAGAQLPYELKEGDDRLSYVPSHPEIFDKTVDMVTRGLLPRYLGPYDGAADLGDYTEFKIVFPTQAAANEWADFVRPRSGGVGSSEAKAQELTINEVPEYTIQT